MERGTEGMCAVVTACGSWPTQAPNEIKCLGCDNIAAELSYVTTSWFVERTGRVGISLSNAGPC